VLGDLTAERRWGLVKSILGMAIAAGRFGSWMSEYNLSPADGGTVNWRFGL
jgi:hypothetical protein